MIADLVGLVLLFVLFGMAAAMATPAVVFLIWFTKKQSRKQSPSYKGNDEENYQHDGRNS